MSQKRISEQNKKNCQKKKAIHTAGTKSFARTREEMRQKDPAKKYPHRAVVYVHTHKRKSDKNINGHVDNLKRLIAEQPALADASKGKTAWKGDALNQILGDDKPGRVHGLGLVPKPKQNSQSHAQDEDKTPPTKHATAHKNKRTFGLNDHGKQMEIICAKEQQCSKMDFITDNSMEVGTKVFLKSWKNRNTNVALATIVSCDPTRRVGGVELGNEFLMVHVDLALAKSEDLIRPYKGYKIVGHVVDKING
ncbi:hypothetical protein OsI_05704 [Oryza sativa Indica Group]|uniref:Transposase Tnp1/En/Spm-like domain-containing protein n=1 Tax=Oryza sativa subsp. indica TaxID=39946 RepID=B8AH07_ORYSI|nr:hypothetical protein OsI_05704 [Oryza sativa Indica Group]